MNTSITSRLKHSIKVNQKGQGLLEYGLILVLVSVASIALIAVFEDELRDVFREFVGDGEFAPPDLQPIGGEYPTRIPSPTPLPEILLFSVSPGSLIEILPAETETDITFDVQTAGSFSLYEVDVDQDGTFDLSWIPGQTSPTYTMSLGKQTFDLRATALGGLQLTASRFVQVYNDVSQLDDTAPIVEISADVTSGETPLTVNFTLVRLDFDADSSAQSYRWAMGNGYVEAGTGAPPSTFSYTFTEYGTFRPLLQVTDNEDFSGFSNELVIEVAPGPTPVPPSPTPTNTPAPFCPGTFDLPGTVQFQDFACNGAGNSYNDTTPGNQGGQYRPAEDVDLYTTTDAGGQYVIGNVENGEWVRYDVNIPTTGVYDILVRAATNSSGESFRIFLDGNDLTGSVPMPNTGGFNNYTDIIVPQVTLVAGSNRMLEFRFEGAANFNFFQVYGTQLSTACSSTFVEAETGTMYGDFIIGNDGAASGGRYIYAPNGAGSRTSGASDSHRAEYCFNVPTTATYKVIGWAHAANGSDNSFYVEVDGTVSTAEAWGVAQNTSYAADYVNTNNGSGPDLEVNLTAGQHTVTVYIREDGARLDRLQLEQQGVNRDPTVNSPGDQTNDMGDSVNLSISASDPDGDSLTYSASGLPTGLSINTSSGTISGSPSASGTYNVTVTVNDGNGGTANTSFTWTVNSAPVTVTYISIDAQDGWIMEDGLTGTGDPSKVDTTGEIRIGDNNTDNESRVAFFTFDTSSLPDNATITNVELRIRRKGKRNDPSNLGAIRVDVAPPTGFSNNFTLEGTDFEAVAAYNAVATLSYPSSNGDWSEGTFNANGMSAISKTGLSQFRVYFTLPDNGDSGDDYLNYNDGGDGNTSRRPQLIITYTTP
ncbi:MAG: carbohydrate-binding protein [Ardenticatenaceae bacterium]|nr:carbohydrate-binding protein [Ardenticatenaceae bacterium]